MLFLLMKTREIFNENKRLHSGFAYSIGVDCYDCISVSG